jgi:hypothetical protein
MTRSPTVSATDAAAAAADGVVFGYPLVLMNRIRAWMTAGAAPDSARMCAPPNRFVHARALRQATSGRPGGARTGALRSSAWLDLGATPVVLSVPETHGRFYALSLVDLWTNVFASVGVRTTGTGQGRYVIAGPDWSGAALPAGALLIRAPTRLARIAGVTQVDADGGFVEAHAVQDAYDLRPLADRRAPPAIPAPPVAGAPPVAQVEQMDARTFFSELAAQMRDNPPRLEDRAIVERLRRLGVLLEDDLAWRRLDRDVRRAVAVGAARGLTRVMTAAESPPGDAVGHWHVRFRRGQYGTDYLHRAAAACAGLEPGAADDELPVLTGTDVHGRRLSGRHRYSVSFAPCSLPPVHGYWTLMTYDGREPLVDNPVERYSIGDWNGLVPEPDGDVTIRIQHADPGREVPNWLPAPSGPFNLLLQLCWPQQEVLDRRWTPPAATPIGS